LTPFAYKSFALSYQNILIPLTIEASAMVMIKAKKDGFEVTAPVMANGTISIPVRVRQMVGIELGEEILVFVPLKQEGARQ
jgi:predicted secreted protein